MHRADFDIFLQPVVHDAWAANQLVAAGSIHHKTANIMQVSISWLMREMQFCYCSCLQTRSLGYNQNSKTLNPNPKQILPPCALATR